MKTKIFRKQIKRELREHFHLNEFYISLNYVENKHIELCKKYLSVVCEDIIFKNLDKFDKNNSKIYLKHELNEFIFKLYGLKIELKEDFRLKTKKDTITLEKAVDMYMQNRKSKVVEGTYKGYNGKKIIF